MSETPIQGILDTTMEKIRAMADADTIVGEQINLGDVTLIPISKVSFGFASGGSDWPSKTDPKMFGGGCGAGMTISPVAFISVQGGDVRLLSISKDTSAAEKAIGLAPEMFDKIASLFKKKKETPETGSEANL